MIGNSLGTIDHCDLCSRDLKLNWVPLLPRMDVFLSYWSETLRLPTSQQRDGRMDMCGAICLLVFKARHDHWRTAGNIDSQIYHFYKKMQTFPNSQSQVLLTKFTKCFMYIFKRKKHTLIINLPLDYDIIFYQNKCLH